MRKQVIDTLGEYTVNIKDKPEELTRATAVYLNLFDNGDRENAARYKLTLSAVDQMGNHLDWTCSILNHFEANQFYRSVPISLRDVPFYRQIHETVNAIKKEDCRFVKKPSAGFFRLPRHKGMTAEQRQIIPNALAMLFIEENQPPMVVLRFMDITFHGELCETGNIKRNAPKWSVCLKSNSLQDITQNVNVEDYF
jgi:hypothetical protein